MPDDAALEIADKILGEGGIEEIKSWDKKQRDEGIAALKARGLSIRQIERLTGIGRNIVARA